MSVPYKCGNEPVHLNDRAYVTSRFYRDLSIQIPSDDPEEENPETPGRDSELTCDSVPEILCHLRTGFERSQRKQIRISLRQLRNLTRRYRDRLLPALLSENVFPFVAMIFTGCPILKLQISALRTLYSFQRFCKGSRSAIATLGLSERIIRMISETDNVSFLGFAIPVLSFNYQVLDWNGRVSFKQNFPIEVILSLHSYLWNYEIRISGPKRVSASLGYIAMLESYCELPMTESEFTRLLEMINFIKSLSTTSSTKRDFGEYFEEMVFSGLRMIESLTKNGLLTPACFMEVGFGAFVNKELRNGGYEGRTCACEIWINLIEHGHTGEGLVLNEVLDVIDQEPNRARHTAFRLMYTLLHFSAIRDQWIWTLVGQSPTNVGYRTFLAARHRDFECLRSCAMCLIEIFRDPNGAEMEILTNDKIVETLMDCLTLEDEELILGVLQSLEKVFDFARSQDEQKWNGLFHVFFDKEGADVVEELAMEWPNERFAYFRDKFQSFFEE